MDIAIDAPHHASLVEWAAKLTVGTQVIRLWGSVDLVLDSKRLEFDSVGD